MPPFAQSRRLKKLLAAAATKTHHFFDAWLRSPFTVGAVMPSSWALAAAMAEQIDPAVPGPIVELGAGTGAITEGLLKVGIPPDRLIVVERDPKLANLMCEHFPQLKVVCADAAGLDGIVKNRSVAAIVSSLPLLSMSRAAQARIVQRMAEAIAERGRIVQFTYGPKSPISRETQRQYGLIAEHVKTVLVNVPPARVWVYTKAR